MQITRRFQWVLPWKLTRAGCLFGQGVKGTFYGWACDEFHNLTFYIMVPLVGQFVLWYERDLNWTVEHLFARGPEGMDGFIDPECFLCAETLGWFLIDEYAVKQ